VNPSKIAKDGGDRPRTRHHAPQVARNAVNSVQTEDVSACVFLRSPYDRREGDPSAFSLEPAIQLMHDCLVCTEPHLPFPNGLINHRHQFRMRLNKVQGSA
jgi:hypothetical protein